MNMAVERLRPETSCRFWQAPYATRPSLGRIGPEVFFRQVTKLTDISADSDVEDDPAYRPRGGFVWYNNNTPSEEEIVEDDLHEQQPHESAPSRLDPVGDLDLSDPDDYDMYEKEDRTASRR